MEHEQAKEPRLSDSAGAVFAVLAGAGSATRPQLAALAGLSKPTVSAAVAELESAGLATRSGTAHGTTGRSAAVYRLGSAAGAVLAIDLGSTHTEVRACALDGTVLAVQVTDSDRGAPEALHEVLGRLAPGPPLRAAVVAVPDVVAPGPDGTGRPATPRIAAAFDTMASALPPGLPVHVENNVNCAALAELHEGAAHGRRTFGYLQVGYGIGLGIVVDGQVLRGANGAAGEVARLPFPWDGQRRPGRESLEEYIGARSLMRRATQAWQEHYGARPGTGESGEARPGTGESGEARPGTAEVRPGRDGVQPGAGESGQGGTEARPGTAEVWSERDASPHAPRPLVGPGEVQSGPGRFLVGPGEVQSGPGRFPVGPGEVQSGPGRFPVGPGEVQSGPGRFPVGPGEAQSGPGRFPVAPGEAQPNPTQPPTAPGEAKPSPTRSPTSHDDTPPRTAERLFALERRGHPLARTLVDAHAADVGRVAAAVAAVLDPGLIVLGGGIGGSGSRRFLHGVRAELERLSWPTEVVGSSLGTMGTVLGAARLAVARGIQTVTQGAPERH